MGIIGEKVGQLAALKCPAFLEFIKANLTDIVNDKDATKGTKSYTGKLTKIEGQGFVYLLAQNKQGRTDRFYWLEYFEGADKLSAKPTAYLNQQILINYKEIEVYQPTEKEYKAIKVITKIEVKP